MTLSFYLVQAIQAIQAIQAMPIIAIENAWALPIEDVLYTALSCSQAAHPKPVGIATRAQRHYGVRSVGAVKHMGFRLEQVPTPDEIPADQQVCWDGWVCFADTTVFKLIPLFEQMQEVLGLAREIKWSREYMGFPSERMPEGYVRPIFDLVKVTQATSGGGYNPALKFPEPSAETALMELYLYPNPSRQALPDLVATIGKQEGLMGVTNRSGAIMRCTDHGLHYSPDARLGFDLKGLTDDLEAFGFFVTEYGFPTEIGGQELPTVKTTQRFNLEEIGVTMPLESAHYYNIL